MYTKCISRNNIICQVIPYVQLCECRVFLVSPDSLFHAELSIKTDKHHIPTKHCKNRLTLIEIFLNTLINTCILPLVHEYGYALNIPSSSSYSNIPSLVATRTLMHLIARGDYILKSLLEPLLVFNLVTFDLWPSEVVRVIADKRTDDVKTITPVVSLTWVVKMINAV